LAVIHYYKFIPCKGGPVIPTGGTGDCFFAFLATGFVTN